MERKYAEACGWEKCYAPDHFSCQHNAGVAKSDPMDPRLHLPCHVIAPHALPACAIPRRCVAMSPGDARRGQARGETGPARADHELARTRAASDPTPPGPTSQSQQPARRERWTPPRASDGDVPTQTARRDDDRQAPSSNHRSPRRPIEE